MGTSGDGGLRGVMSPPAVGSCRRVPPGPSYTEADEHKIQHCFCYTSTVLTSTLAFQKEQKLKCECQVSACVTPGHARARGPPPP